MFYSLRESWILKFFPGKQGFICLGVAIWLPDSREALPQSQVFAYNLAFKG
jgi:hypothetical protein